jgi:hypothetical protein
MLQWGEIRRTVSECEEYGEPVLLFIWQDQKVVKLMSTIHDGTGHQLRPRRRPKNTSRKGTRPNDKRKQGILPAGLRTHRRLLSCTPIPDRRRLRSTNYGWNHRMSRLRDFLIRGIGLLYRDSNGKGK